MTLSWFPLCSVVCEWIPLLVVLVAVTISIAIWALCVELRAFSVLVHTAKLSCARRCVWGGVEAGDWNLLCWALASISQSSPRVLCFQLVHPPTGARTASTRATATTGPSAAPTTGNASALLAGQGSTARSVSGQPLEPKGSPTREDTAFPCAPTSSPGIRVLGLPNDL